MYSNAMEEKGTYNNALIELLVAAEGIATTLFVSQKRRVISIQDGQRLIDALYKFERLPATRDVALMAHEQIMRETAAELETMIKERRSHVPHS